MKTFPRGVHPNSHKSMTEKLNIEVMATPARLYIPLKLPSGTASEPVVAVGAEVKEGQLIAKAAARNGLNVFASCCGTVKAIEERPTPTAPCLHIVIENNGKRDTAHLPPLQNPSAEEIIKRVADCGVAGMGGAGFPTADKLSPEHTIETLIINAAECEPYVTCDHRIMLEYTSKFMQGVLLIQKAVSAKSVIIGIENNKPDAILALNEYITQNSLSSFSVEPLKVKYPQGSDKQLIYALTRKKIAKGRRSSSYGLIVNNVHTALSVYLAVKEGRQCYSRIMTVTGKGINNPKNLWVPNGSTFADIIEFCGGMNTQTPPVKMIDGGPMMGRAVYSPTVSTGRMTGCLLLLAADEYDGRRGRFRQWLTSPYSADFDCYTGQSGPCINCGKCARVCPMGLMPMYIDSMAQSGFLEDTKRYGISYCIECGCCAYICPAKRTLTQSIRLAKTKLKEME